MMMTMIGDENDDNAVSMSSNGKTSIVYYRTLSFFAFRNLKKRKFAFFRVFKFKIIIEPVRFRFDIVKF